MLLKDVILCTEDLDSGVHLLRFMHNKSGVFEGSISKGVRHTGTITRITESEESLKSIT